MHPGGYRCETLYFLSTLYTLIFICRYTTEFEYLHRVSQKPHDGKSDLDFFFLIIYASL